MTLDEIDFAAMYREHMAAHRLRLRPARAWDGRAAEYGRNRRQSSYVADFIARMDFSGAHSLLDVGCGPGTLALPLARRLGRVVALDYSEGMLQQLRRQAAEQGVGNIVPMHRAWEDDWHDVPVCDIAIASRSTTVDDLGDALEKLDRHAGLRVYLTYLVGGHFIDRRIRDLLDSPLPATPDHLMLLGMLHRMGRQPRVDYLHTPSRLTATTGFDDFAQRLEWSTGPLGAAERQRLQHWYEGHPEWAREGGGPMRWAFVSWEVDGSRVRTPA